MNRLPFTPGLALSLLSLLCPLRAFAVSPDIQNHIITVNGEGDAAANPDLGIMVMTIRSTAPIAEEAVTENGRKAKAVESGLAALGYSSKAYKITSVTFGDAGGSPDGIVAYQASQFVYVFFDAPDLRDAAKLTEKTAAVIEALRKAGAVPANFENPLFPPAQGALIVYTVKDPAAYERQALQKAIARAREAAQDVARGLGVQITGVRNVRTGYSMGGAQYGSVALDGLSFSFYATKSDELRIRANATVEYDFK